jgi:ABC-type amino acid transport substrate-binding protein
MEQEGSGARLATERSSGFIGWCSLANWNAEYRSASMGYCLDEAAWGQGFATEAAHTLLQWAFKALDLNRVQAQTDTRNAASGRVLEKLGFLPKAPCGKIASWMARCRTPGCMGCSGRTGIRYGPIRWRIAVKAAKRSGNARRNFVLACVALVAFASGFGATGAAAQEAAKGRVRVAVKRIEPFVFKQGTELSGFSIDLWKDVAQSLKVDTTWVEVTTVGDQLKAVKEGKADAAIAAITITKEREEDIDFTQPYFDSGLQIMVRSQGGSHLLNVFDSIPWLTIGALLGAFLAIMFVMANVLWIVERKTSEQFRGGYLKGIGEGLWGIALIVATGEHGDRQASRVVKRLIVFFMWLVGVVLIAQLTATVTSTQTVDRLTSSIRGPNDLTGKRIATVRGTTAAEYLIEQGLQYVEVASADEGSDLVLRGEVQALVFDAPALQYLASKRGNGVLQVVGPIFAPQKYGIAVADGSPLRKRIDRALLEMYEDGRYKRIYDKWFSRG